MGKVTKRQAVEKRALDTALAGRKPKEGVYITNNRDDKVLAFEGDFEAQLTPTGVVCIIEMVPDLENKNKGQPVPVVRQFINNDRWAEIIVR